MKRYHAPTITVGGARQIACLDGEDQPKPYEAIAQAHRVQFTKPAALVDLPDGAEVPKGWTFERTLPDPKPSGRKPSRWARWQAARAEQLQLEAEAQARAEAHAAAEAEVKAKVAAEAAEVTALRAELEPGVTDERRAQINHRLHQLTGEPPGPATAVEVEAAAKAEVEVTEETVEVPIIDVVETPAPAPVKASAADRAPPQAPPPEPSFKPKPKVAAPPPAPSSSAPPSPKRKGKKTS